MSLANLSYNFSKKSKFLRRLFVVALFACLVAIFYLTANLGLKKVRNSIEEQYEEDGQNLVRVYSLAVQNMINQSYLMLDILSQIDEIKYGTTQTAYEWILKNRNIKPTSFLNIFYADETGMAYLNTGEQVYVGDRSYFKKIFSNNTVYDLDTAVISKTSGKKIFHVSKAVFDKDERIKGIVGGSIELSQLQKLLSAAQISNKMTPFVLDENGYFISHVNSEFLMKTYIPTDPKYEKYSSIAIATGHFEKINTIDSRGESVRVFIEQIKTTPWTVGVSIPYSEIYKTYHALEIGKRWVLVTTIIAGMVFYVLFISSIGLLKKQYESANLNDPLTGLYTRSSFEKIATDMLTENPQGSFIVMEADFVGFKFLNKTYGEQIGNEVLETFATFIKEMCEIYGGIASRGYADHFYYFNKITGKAKVSSVLRLAKLKIDSILKQQKYPFTPKYGITFKTPKKEGDITSGDKSIQELIFEASMAKSSIKKDINIDFATYNEQMANKILMEQKIERLMNKALENDEFYVLYQPKINLENDKIIGAEALARWQSAELGYLTPDKFIPIFENNGFIKKLDFAVYEMVFKFIRKQLDENQPVVTISLNMSRVHVDASEFIEKFMTLFNKYNIPSKLIEIEILERSGSTEKPILLEITEELHKRGFVVAMDDFGSGESSLNMLNSVPIDVLKFDQNFLRNTTNEKENEAFIASLVKMAQQMHKKTVFEGVETEEQRDFLRSINCDCVQGYFYSKPLSEADFVKFMKSHL